MPLTLAVWKFCSCDGCQLSLLDAEDELMTLASAVQISYFRELTRTALEGPYDLSLVEGSITTQADVDRIRRVRSVSKRLVTIGACAVAGGIQALRNVATGQPFASIVYPSPEYIDSLARSSPVAAHVTVDFELRGCPVDTHQLLEVLGAFVNGRTPVVPQHAVCLECKAHGIPCLTVARGIPCLGPVTHAGCGAICPAYARGCYGCFGPMETPNTASLATVWAGLGVSRDDLARALRSFNADADAFKVESRTHDRE